MGNDKARSRFFLSALLITSLLLITLDLRGNLPSEGLRKVSATVGSPFQSLFNSIYRPVSTFTGDLFSLGRTRNKISNLQKENAALKEELSRKNAIKNEVKELLWEIKKDYDGDHINITFGTNPVIHQWQDDDPQKPIKGSSITINIINEGNISLDDFYSNEDDTFQVILYKINFLISR